MEDVHFVEGREKEKDYRQGQDIVLKSTAPMTYFLQLGPNF
jgi:hypothetical protein